MSTLGSLLKTISSRGTSQYGTVLLCGKEQGSQCVAAPLALLMVCLGPCGAGDTSALPQCP